LAVDFQDFMIVRIGSVEMDYQGYLCFSTRGHQGRPCLPILCQNDIYAVLLEKSGQIVHPMTIG
jgi:hypothetical protein